ncbi:MAG: hypothetical protein OJF62_003207 [Pseudolabrys sp.]|jgi:uncharacterized protein (DUF302 family)|nr:hypothetical protein [Pseudolabrys sp.]
MSSNDGLVTCRSQHGNAETSQRFCVAARNVGLSIFAQIDHGQNAVDSGLELRPTRLIIFGNPRGGTPLMQLNQVSGIDLPFKVLVWDDQYGATWLTYNDPEWLVERHCLGTGAETTTRAISDGMKKLVSAATR